MSHSARLSTLWITSPLLWKSWSRKLELGPGWFSLSRMMAKRDPYRVQGFSFVSGAKCWLAASAMQIVITAPWTWMSFLSFAIHVATFSLPVPLRKSGRSREGWWGRVSTLPPQPPPPPPSLVLLCPEGGGGCLLRTIRDFPGGSQDLRAVCCLPLAVFSHYLHDLGDVGQMPPYFFLVIYLFGCTGSS